MVLIYAQLFESLGPESRFPWFFWISRVYSAPGSCLIRIRTSPGLSLAALPIKSSRPSLGYTRHRKSLLSARSSKGELAVVLNSGWLEYSEYNFVYFIWQSPEPSVSLVLGAGSLRCWGWWVGAPSFFWTNWCVSIWSAASVVVEKLGGVLGAIRWMAYQASPTQGPLVYGRNQLEATRARSMVVFLGPCVKETGSVPLHSLTVLKPNCAMVGPIWTNSRKVRRADTD